MPIDLTIRTSGKQGFDFADVLSDLTDPTVGGVDAATPYLFDFGNGMIAEIVSPTKILVTYSSARTTLTLSEPLDFKGSDEELQA